MSTEPAILSEEEQKAVVLICVMAAFVDGTQNETERSQVKRIVEGFSNERLDLSTVCQEALLGKVSLEQVVSTLQTPRAKALAFEMAVCVCNADHVLTDEETKFLAKLREELKLESGPATAFQQSASALTSEPLKQPPVIISGPNKDSEVDKMIVNCATLNGALEIMPHSLATMAIVPLQMRMVYRIGKSYGYDLDRGHIKDFLATVGVGLTSQVVESYLGRLIGSVGRHVAGRFLGGLVGQAAESGIAFASTYALGQVAKRYYASNRTLSAGQLQDVFSSMLSEGRSIKGSYANEIALRSRAVKMDELLPLVRQQ